MKLFLALAAFVALAYAGLSRAISMTRRVSVMRALVSDIKKLDGEMSYKRLPLKRLLASAMPLSLPGFWQAALDALVLGETAQKAFASAVENDAVRALVPSERAVLMDYLSVLGHTQLKSQNENAENAVRRLTQLADTLEKERRRCGGLYGQLGIFSGLAAALILI